MADQEFLAARALEEVKRVYEKLTIGGQKTVDALLPAAAVAPDVLALAGLDARFVVAGAMLPRPPTSAELVALPAGKMLSGAYMPDGWQRLMWDRNAARWVEQGERTATAQQVDVVRSSLTLTRLQLASGTVTIPAGVSRIWDEFGSLAVRAALNNEICDLVITYPLGENMVAERENLRGVDVRWAGAIPDQEQINDEAFLLAATVAVARGLPVVGAYQTYVVRHVVVPNGPTTGELIFDEMRVLADISEHAADIVIRYDPNPADNGSPTLPVRASVIQRGYDLPMFYLDGLYRGAGPLTLAKLESARKSNIRFGRNFRLDGRRGAMRNITLEGDGRRYGVLGEGRLSNITFQGEAINCATDNVTFFSGLGSSAVLGDQASDDDPCFINIVYDGARLHWGRRHGWSCDVVKGMRHVGDGDYQFNGLNLPDFDGSDKRDGRAGAVDEQNGQVKLYGNGGDLESYNIGGRISDVYIAPSIKAINNAGAGIHLNVGWPEYDDSRFQPWDNIQVFCQVDAGVSGVTKNAIEIVGTSAHKTRDKPLLTNAVISPIRQKGRLLAQFVQGTLAPETVETDGGVWADVSGCDATIIQRPNNPRFAVAADANVHTEGTLPPFPLNFGFTQTYGPAIVFGAVDQVVLSRTGGSYEVKLNCTVTASGTAGLCEIQIGLNPVVGEDQVLTYYGICMRRTQPTLLDLFSNVQKPIAERSQTIHTTTFLLDFAWQPRDHQLSLYVVLDIVPGSS